ncbi:MAG TPA: hypothetical protein VI457_05805 [Methylococcaceae bacterium]|nr:hypothetical protein [Methylococcaceae bacterium]
MNIQKTLKAIFALSFLVVSLSGADGFSQDIAYAAQDIEQKRTVAMLSLCDAKPPLNVSYLAAARNFQNIAEAKPNDIEALYYQAIALNRAGLYKPAVETINKARSLGGRQGGLPLELGWSYVGLGRSQAAIRELSIYERSHSGDIQAIQLLAHAYYLAGETQQAHEALARILRIDPRMKASISGIEDYMAANKNWQDPPPSLPPEICSKSLSVESGMSIKKGNIEGYGIQLAVGGGYNSNPMGLGNIFPLPAGIPNQDSSFFETKADLSYRKLLTQEDLLTLDYAFQAKIYGEAAISRNFDLLDHRASANLRHFVASDLSLALSLLDDYTELGGNSLRNQFTLKPTLAYQLNHWVTGEIGYRFTNEDFYFSSVSLRDRDNTANGMDLTAYLTIPDSRFRGRLGYAYNAADSEGRDFDYFSNALIAGLGYTFPRGISVDTYYTRTYYRFDHINSLSLSGSNRDDETDSVSLDVKIPIHSNVSTYLHYDYMGINSNIPIYEFSKHTATAGIALNY